MSGNVDKNIVVFGLGYMLLGRSLRGNVDRNTPGLVVAEDLNVVPYVGTWIEISRSAHRPGKRWSFPTWERG